MPDPVTAIAGSAVVGAGTSLFGASKSSSASKKAAKAQADSAAYAADVQMEMYKQTREDQTPWREAGQQALDRFKNEVFATDYTKTPGYAWRVSEGVKAQERSAAARGGLLSGAEQKALTTYGQNQASQEYGNWMNRLGALSGVGQTATTATSAAGAAAANGMASATLAGGNATASGYIGQANAMTGGLNGVANALNSGLNNYMLYSKLSTPNYANAGWGDAGILAGSGPR